MNFSRSRAVAALAAIAILAAFTAAACGDDGGSSELPAAIAGITYIDNSGFHELDESLTLEGKVPATAHSTAFRIQSVALTTAWPKELKASADKMAKAMGDYAAAIDTETPDIKKATELSNAAHKAWHDFSTATWDYLAEEAGLKKTGHAGASH